MTTNWRLTVDATLLQLKRPNTCMNLDATALAKNGRLVLTR